MVDRKLVEEIVREAVDELQRAQAAQEAVPAPFQGPLVDLAAARPCDDGLCKPPHFPKARVFDEAELQAIKQASPARLAQGRTGTRYLTAAYVGLRAEHAVALDAVEAEVPEGLPQRLGCLALKSRCKDHQEFLLQPDLGRRLDDASKARLQAEGSRGADVQVICGDGLSAWALEENGPALLPALNEALSQEGFKLGRPLFVKYARVGVQDEIGALLGARCTVILLGERPGLGTGDSLSIYSAYGPRLGQDNAEKDCISNVRPLGLKPAEAASACARLLRRSFDAGGGGVRLNRSGR
jgi:ethanolamine ammonia-lyase small subunit